MVPALIRAVKRVQHCETIDLVIRHFGSLIVICSLLHIECVFAILLHVEILVGGLFEKQCLDMVRVRVYSRNSYQQIGGIFMLA